MAEVKDNNDGNPECVLLQKVLLLAQASHFLIFLRWILYGVDVFWMPRMVKS